MLLILAATLAATSLQATQQRRMMHPDRPQSETIPRYSSEPQPRGYERMRRAMLVSHNDARRDVGVPPLIWDDDLADNAAEYAEVLARTGIFRHEKQDGRRPYQGENLWMGSRGAYSYYEMSELWVDEKRLFKRGDFPASSRSGRWSDVGHYTQIIWATTTRFGCAMASNRDNDYLVCRYSPAGNVYGRNPLKG